MNLFQPLRRCRRPLAGVLLGPLLLVAGCVQTRIGDQESPVESQEVRSAQIDVTGPGKLTSAPVDVEVRPAVQMASERPGSDAEPPAVEPLPASALASPTPPDPAMPIAPTW